jgi:aldose sugar dehydrogenase
MRPDNTDENAEGCLCPGCPTYNECMQGKSERLFCSRGATDCGPEPHGCICGECPVWASYGLGSYYFCREGAAS